MNSNMRCLLQTHRGAVSLWDEWEKIDLCGIKAHKDAVLDGESVKPALMGQKMAHDEIYCHFPHYIPATGNVPSTYVRKGDWKLIRHYHDNDDQTHRYELYNLHTDIGEMINLASTFPEKVKEMDRMIDRHLEETGAVFPVANPDYTN